MRSLPSPGLGAQGPSERIHGAAASSRLQGERGQQNSREERSSLRFFAMPQWLSFSGLPAVLGASLTCPR